MLTLGLAKISGMGPRFSTLLWIATRAKGTSVADALVRLPATRLHIDNGFVHILWDPDAWGVPAAVARGQAFDALRESYISFEPAIGVIVGPVPDR